MDNIILIGMPGSGKSTLGVLLAKALGYSFIDTDLLISRRANKTLQEILDDDGLEAFLKLEEEVGRELDCTKTVIATGGSMVLSDSAMENLKKGSKVVYIDVPFSEIERRVYNIKTRGIAFRKNETLRDVFNSRQPLYDKHSDITVKIAENGQSIEDTVEKLSKQLK